MSPKELHNMIQLIKTLPDKSLIRIIRIATGELLKRTRKPLEEIQDESDKGQDGT